MTLALLINPNQTAAQGIERQQLRSQTPNDSLSLTCILLRSKGLLNGLAAGTNWVFRDESAHIAFAFEVIATIRREEAELFDAELERRVALHDGASHRVRDELAEDLLSQGVAGLSLRDMRAYLEFIADQRLAALRMPQLFGSRNPFRS